MIPLLALGLAALAAGPPEPAAVTVWHAYRGEERAALEGLLDEYDDAHPELTVVTLAVPYDSYVTKLEAAAPRGNGPDLFVAAHERIGAWAASGLIQPVGLDADRFHPVTVRAVTRSDQTWGIPLAFKCLALFINRDLVDTPPRTTDELLRIARAQRGPNRFGLAYPATEPYFHAPWMHGFGGGIFQGEVVALDSQENIDSLRFARDLQRDGIVPEEPTTVLVTQLFNDGRAAMVINGPWFLGEVADDVHFEVHPLPLVSDTGLPAAPFVTVDAAMVSAYARHPEAAVRLGDWLTETAPAVTRAVEGRQSVATLAAHAVPEVANDPILSAFRAQLDRAEPMSNRPEMAATWEPMARAIRRAMRGAVTPEDALREAQAHFAIVTRPPPPRVSAWPYVLGFGMLLLAAVVWGGRRAWVIRAEIRASGFAYRYVLPSALAMLLLVVVPFAVGSAMGFFAHRDGAFTFVGLANFSNILLARDWPIGSPLSFWFTLLVTVGWTVANVALHVVLGVTLALLLRAPWMRLRGLYRVLLILPWAVPNYITALIWKGMFHRQFGAINGLLITLGLEPVSWFSRFSTAFAANLATNTWLGFPFMMVVTLGALQAIPRDLEEAAAVDGANAWQRFRHVILPLLRPALLPAVILGSVWTFNMFNVIYLVSGGEPDGGTEILISEAYRWAFTRGHRYGYAAAYAVLIFIVLLISAYGSDRALRRRTA